MVCHGLLSRHHSGTSAYLWRFGLKIRFCSVGKQSISLLCFSWDSLPPDLPTRRPSMTYQCPACRCPRFRRAWTSLRGSYGNTKQPGKSEWKLQPFLTVVHVVWTLWWAATMLSPVGSVTDGESDKFLILRSEGQFKLPYHYLSFQLISVRSVFRVKLL